MSVIWSGITEEGAIVPVQVDTTGRVISIVNDTALDYWVKKDNTLKPSDGESVSVEGTVSSTVSFLGPTASFTADITIHGLSVGRGGGDLDSNTAVGRNALANNTEGNNNTAFGRSALFNNAEGDNNTAVGLNALYSNTTGDNNTAVGQNALYNNTTGVNNTAVGRSALYNNTEGVNNTAFGQNALYSNTEGDGNTAVGLNALFNHTEGDNNTAFGRSALTNLKTGENNTFIGQNPGLDGLNDTVCISAGDTYRLWIDSEGQAGIGTNNPQATLDVAGPALFSNGLCGFLASGEIFFQSRNTSYKLVVASNGLVSAEPIPAALLRLEDRQELVIPPFIEPKEDDGLPIVDMDNDNA